ncbi:hypothetical protein ACJIZ3_002354 [Penstemon smallii]|uniref:Pectinesterase n=1 Tax=Penstemon smallii TaxID=265156 RepID=A0ABD3U821_9LAMI
MKFIVFVVLNLNAFAISQITPFPSSLKDLCGVTPYPNTCYNNLAPLVNQTINYDSQIIYELSVQISIDELTRVSKDFAENGKISKTFKNLEEIINLQSAQESCRVLLDLALYNLNWSLPKNSYANLTTFETRENLKTWIYGAGTDLETCIDGFDIAPYQVKKVVIENLNNSTRLVRNSLAIIFKIDDYIRTHYEHERVSSRKFASDLQPTWFSSDDMILLKDSKQMVKPNVVVAADGTGNYKTISDALKVVPQNSNTRFVIYVKKGVYYENVNVGPTKWNVMMYGDGMDNTIVSGNLNGASGVGTFSTATFAVQGKGFIGRDIGFQNTAGPAKGQAVALLSTADQSVFYRCSIDGYQDTLYTHSMRQFYRDCKIYGTIDIIFGDSSVVIQNSSILVKRPLHGQSNVITAQGKSGLTGSSGISIQNCDVSPSENLAGVRTYLGRPWKDYSTTIFMECFLGSLIDPQGWARWIDNVPPPDTIYYAEYNNRGPGAFTGNRVNWKGVRTSVSPDEANKFTVRSFISGVGWLSPTSVPFQPDL